MDLRLPFVAALSLAATAAAADSTPCDTSEKGIAAFYKKAKGRDLGGQCMSMPSSTFVGLLVARDFANDAGCIVSDLVYRCTLNAPDAGKRALVDAGWAAADEKKKIELAFAWHTETTTQTPLKTPPPEFGKKKFELPSGTQEKDGSVVLRFWVRDPPGMRPGKFFHLYTRAFAADGTPAEVKQVEKLTTP